LKTPRATPSECPVCGADVPPRARACPSCGADERTGWNEDTTRYDGLDLPDAAFDDDASPLSKNLGHNKRRFNGIPFFWWLLALIVLAACIAAALGFSPVFF
jgi:hypothetical protein